MSYSFISQMPNALTLSRIIGAIFMVFYYYFGSIYKFEILWVVFAFAAISDFFDGYISRKFNAISNFGKCFDPISDKLLLVVCLILLVDAKLINLIIAFILIGREIIISGLREFLSLQNIELPVSRVAKWKTAFQLLGVGMCFFTEAKVITSFYLENLNNVFALYPITFIMQNLKISTFVVLILASITTLYTGASYIYHSIKYFKK